MSAKSAPALQRRLSPGEAARFYRPLNWQAGPEPASDPIEALSLAFVPNPARSYEAALRHRHGDLAGMDGTELWRERWAATFVAALLPPGEGRSWAEGRLRAVAAEQLARRRGGADGR